MKSRLLKKVRSKRNLESAWKVIEENGRSSKSKTVRNEIERFREDPTKNIELLYRSLQKGTFVFPPAKGIALPKDKSPGAVAAPASIRPIVLAKVESRIVQRSVLNVLTDLPGLQRYIDNPHSFGGLRKTEPQRLSAVPAAVSSVLDEIDAGAKFVMSADISGFFTRIPKSAVTSLISEAAADPEFVQFFEKAIHVELANMAELRELGSKFPIEDLGVAQGNSLSPLLGNILLNDFDHQMNAGDCRCKRYIDDFIILAPNAAAAASRMRLAQRLLSKFGMELSASKTSKSPISIDDGFDFLGIQFANGFVRPSQKARTKLVQNVESEFKKSMQAFHACRTDAPFDSTLSFVATLKRVDGIIRGWGKHYYFCNDADLFARIDARLDELLRSYAGNYAGCRERTRLDRRRSLLGVERLTDMERRPFRWPKDGAKIFKIMA